MSEFITSILIIGTELSAVLILVTTALFFIFSKKRRRDKVISEQFIQSFKENADVRRQHIEKQLEEINEDKEIVFQIIENIIRKEKAIYGKMLKIFHGKEKELLLDVQNDLQELTDEFGVRIIRDDSSNAADQTSIDEKVQEMEQKNTALKTENDRLKDDLKKALETIDSIQAEYEQLYKKTKNMEIE